MQMRHIIPTLGVFLTILGLSSASAVTAPSPYADLFDEIVETVEEHFYNPVQINHDFPAIQETYRKQLVQVSTNPSSAITIPKLFANAHSSFHLKIKMSKH